MSEHRLRIEALRVVFHFRLFGETWNWPVDGADSIEAFRELLDRARVSYTERVDA